MKKSIKIVLITVIAIIALVVGILIGKLFGNTKAIESKDICKMTRVEYSEYCDDAFDKVYANNTYTSRDERDAGLDELYDLYFDMEDDLRLAMLVDEVNGEEHYEKLAMILEQSFNTHWDSMYEEYNEQCDN